MDVLPITKNNLLLLSNQSCPNVTNLNKLPYVADPERIKFLLTAAIHTIANRKILKATLFWKSTRKPAYLIFCDEEQEQFWTYDVSSRRWRDACLHNLVGEIHSPMLCIANTDQNVGAGYFREKNRLTSYCILNFQFAVRGAEFCGCSMPYRTGSTVRVQYERGHQFLETIMEQVEPLPSDIHQFIDLHVLPKSRYFYYRRKKSRMIGYCSHCKTVSAMPLPKQKGTLFDKVGKCPHCHSKVIFKPEGRACQIQDDGRMEFIQRIDDGVLIRSFYVLRTLPKSYLKQYEEHWHEDYRTFISHSGKKFEFYYYQSHFGTNEWRYVDSYKSYYSGRPYCPGGVLYTKNLNQIIKGTRFQYSQIAEFSHHMERMYSADYLQRYMEVPSIEYLVKLKMFRLLEDVLKSYSRVLDDPGGKNPAEVFGVPKGDVKKLVCLNVSGPELELWRWCRNNAEPISEKDIQIIQSCDMKTGTFDFVRQYFELHTPNTNLTKFLSYLKKQKGSNKETSLSYLGSDWLDYIKACRDLKYDLSDENTLYPRNLVDAHDKATALVKITKSQKEDAAIRKQYQKNLKAYEFKTKEFLVTVPSCAADLVAEGQKMHHCVGTYLGRVAKGECVILFVRRTSAPDKPFVTAEIRDNRLVQIRAKNNAIPSEVVKAFWEEFAAEKLTVKVKKKKSRKAG